jgi:hypothetical protein
MTLGVIQWLNHQSDCFCFLVAFGLFSFLLKSRQKFEQNFAKANLKRTVYPSTKRAFYFDLSAQ